jgi:hypothetical protein
MLKIILAVVATAVLAFATGIWTQDTLAGRRDSEIRAANVPSTISPAEMHRNLKPGDLPVQYMQADFN